MVRMEEWLGVAVWSSGRHELWRASLEGYRLGLMRELGEELEVLEERAGVCVYVGESAVLSVPAVAGGRLRHADARLGWRWG